MKGDKNEKYATRDEIKRYFEVIIQYMEKLDRKIDGLMLTKADKRDVLDLHDRVLRLERKEA